MCLSFICCVLVYQDNREEFLCFLSAAFVFTFNIYIQYSFKVSHTQVVSDSKPSTSKSSDKLTSGRVKNLAITGTVLGAKRKINDETIFKSDAFKSIFTSHDSAKRSKENTSHWITYNPYH